MEIIPPLFQSLWAHPAYGEVGLSAPIPPHGAKRRAAVFRFYPLRLSRMWVAPPAQPHNGKPAIAGFSHLQGLRPVPPPTRRRPRQIPPSAGKPPPPFGMNLALGIIRRKGHAKAQTRKDPCPPPRKDKPPPPIVKSASLLRRCERSEATR